MPPAQRTVKKRDFKMRALLIATLAALCLLTHPMTAAAQQQAANNQQPEVKVKGTYGDWQVKCLGDSKECQIYQLLKDDQGQPVMEISMFKLPAGQEAAAGATVIAPLETYLLDQMTIEFNKENAKKYPFSFCTRIGCIARIGLTGDEIATFKASNDAKVAITHIATPGKPLMLKLSLKGFTKAYGSL